MCTYFAKLGNNGIYLTRDEQMEQFLENGASIYRDENGTETLIATPEQGFLLDRPTFPIEKTAAPADSEYAIAGRILLGLED